jgi:hypothetical protein
MTDRDSKHQGTDEVADLPQGAPPPFPPPLPRPRRTGRTTARIIGMNNGVPIMGNVTTYPRGPRDK